VRSKQHVRTEYDAAADGYEQRWWEYSRRSIGETIRRAGVETTERVLDVGCGTGTLLRELSAQASSVIAGIDLSIGMVAKARGDGVAAIAGDAESLPFRDRVFDVVISSSSFHFWPNRAMALMEIRRVLKPGGRVVITDWCNDFLTCRVCDLYLRWRDPAHQATLTRRACGELLEAAGFRLESFDRYRISWLWGLMTVVALAPAPLAPLA
jgi:ubiquinone/menaquinone biosynthesis C-methylase UbiE